MLKAVAAIPKHREPFSTFPEWQKGNTSEGEFCMLGRNIYLKSGLIALVLCFWPAPKALAETPRQQLQGTIDRVMEVMQTIRSAEDIERSKGSLRQILLARFDFAEMARRSLGKHWNNLNGKEGEFVSTFTQFIEGSYMGVLGSYRGEKVVYGQERVEQEFAEVDTRILGGQGTPMEVHYRLHLVGGVWKVYDVVIDHVSLVSNYQSQFSRILRSAPLEELLKKLREKGEGARG
ncbi:MAG: ABC transporter substrate-binding protein [Deltaproteobacteria bacterium]|nr:ABC transporter substrate-binding protein [Deltaproteobacteria bacterium]